MPKIKPKPVEPIDSLHPVAVILRWRIEPRKNSLYAIEIHANERAGSTVIGNDSTTVVVDAQAANHTAIPASVRGAITKLVDYALRLYAQEHGHEIIRKGGPQNAE